MKFWTSVLAIIGACGLHLNVAAQTEKPLPVLDAFPTPETLGSGWSREITLLFDPVSKPAEIVPEAARLSENFKKEKREAVENPFGRISGLGHAHYDFQEIGQKRYEVQVDRYRDQKMLTEDFNKLLTTDKKEYQKSEVKGVGDAAVVYRQGGSLTLWFRRGTFQVWISPLNAGTSWEEDLALQQLAKAFDKLLSLKG